MDSRANNSDVRTQCQALRTMLYDLGQQAAANGCSVGYMRQILDTLKMADQIEDKGTAHEAHIRSLSEELENLKSIETIDVLLCVYHNDEHPAVQKCLDGWCVGRPRLSK